MINLAGILIVEDMNKKDKQQAFNHMYDVDSIINNGYLDDTCNLSLVKIYRKLSSMLQ